MLEFNPSQQNTICELLGTPEEKVRYPAVFAYVDDEQELPIMIGAYLTWYDTRRKKKDIRGPEWRLYYPAETERVIESAAVGDTLLLAQRLDGSLMVVLARQNSEVLRQLEWLFDFSRSASGLFVDAEMDSQPSVSSVTADRVLSMLGIPLPTADADLSELLLARFPGDDWPKTALFSNFARKHFGEVDPVNEPDATLNAWVEHEHKLFRTLEKHRISETIREGFLSANGDVDVDAFIKMSLGANNRRKARAGLSLELHMEALLKANKIKFVKKAKTEGKKEPDFLFPSKASYHDPEFPNELLTMLGSKTSLRDRWRQVINEANRISTKHLLTLQAPISEDQTDEMREEKIRLVIPRQHHTSGFSSAQQAWLMSVSDFLDEVRTKEVEIAGMSVTG
jgi:hypothetical protein